MKQLLSINDSIQKLSKKKGDKSRARRMTRKISRKPTLAEITDEEQTFSRRDEITLLTNIKVWKYSQSDESSSGSESDLLSEWTFCFLFNQSTYTSTWRKSFSSKLMQQTANPRQISLKRKLRPDLENANVIRHSLRHHFSCLISLSSPFTDESWVSYWRWMTVDQRRCGLVGSSVSVLSVLLFLTWVYCIKFCDVL